MFFNNSGIGKIFKALTFVVLTTCAGFYFAQMSWNGVVYMPGLEAQNGRTPAAIRRELDFSMLEGAELITASQKRLVTAAREVLSKDSLGIELGHFVTKGKDGKSKLACSVYDRVSLRFEAEGMAENGEKPTMEIESPCLPSKDISFIEAVWIPVARITGGEPADMDLQYDGSEARFKFSSMGSEWPKQWRLQSVRLYHENSDNNESNDSAGSRQVTISGLELRELREKPLVLNWNKIKAQ